MYVLVTDFEDHWDVQQSQYPAKMVKVRGDLLNDTPTLFIKRGSRGIEKGWHGKVKNIQRKDGKVSFDVVLEREAEHEELRPYNHLRNGWHEVDDGDSAQLATSESTNSFTPPFFEEMTSIHEPEKFEYLCYYLLRLIGIHRTYRFSREEQAGKPDGFFKFQNLAVIYDTTLQPSFEERKKQQIENYCKMLHSGMIEPESSIKEEVGSHQKQVWIITRGKSRRLSIHAVRDAVMVKEISIDDLIRMYFDRLEYAWSEEELVNRLVKLGEKS